MKRRMLSMVLAFLLLIAQLPTVLASTDVIVGEKAIKDSASQSINSTLQISGTNSSGFSKTPSKNISITARQVRPSPAPADLPQRATSSENSDVSNSERHMNVAFDHGVLTISGTGAMESSPARFESAEALFNGELASTVPWKNSIPYIEAADIQPNITSIGNMAFAGAENMTSVTIADSVTSVGIAAFADCTALAHIELPASISSIGEYAFWDCRALIGIAVPVGVSIIREGTFGDCAGLLSVVIPESVTAIEKEAFGYCTALANVTIPDSVASMGEAAFYACGSLRNVVLSKSMSEIREASFYDCGALASVTIPVGVTSIGEAAFANCDHLTDVYYGGSAAEWDAVAIGDANEALKSAAIHYESLENGSAAAGQKNQYVSGQFADVPADHWCAEYVKVAYENGVMNGKSENNFDTTGNLTIAQAVVMASRLHSSYQNIPGNFQASQPWYQSYLDYALAHGIVTKLYDDYNVPISRAEFAVILSRTVPRSSLAEVNSVEDGAIPDVSADFDYYTEIYQLYRAGILTGNDEKGTFTPSSNISRGAAAAIISRLIVPSLRRSITLQAAPFEPVPMNKLENLSSLRKKCTDAELKEAYDVAVEIVTPLAKLGRKAQLQGVMQALRQIAEDIAESGGYSTSAPHYNDPYGYFVLHTASCAGCTRATGLCLNILGIAYEHVNPDSWSHQWCRVNVDGSYWICDAYGFYCGEEPAPYQHPYVNT